MAGLCFLSCFLLSANSLLAQGDVLIYPKRIVFDGSERSQELHLVNQGFDTARYVISVVQIRMKEDGSFEHITVPDAGQHFADKNFRFFPRSVILGPKETQTVKVQLLQFSSLPGGEYRSHLYFRAERAELPLGFEKAKQDSGKLSISIIPVYGISIPVIIRSGEFNSSIGLSRVDFHFEKDTVPILQMNITRDGDMSVYGDIIVDYVSESGKEIRVAVVKGVAVYTPISKRMVRILLKRDPHADYHKGSLHVVFTENSGKSQKVAQDQVFLN